MSTETGIFLCDRRVNGGASGHCILPDDHDGKCRGDVDEYVEEQGR